MCKNKVFALTARISKCDFLNLWKISVRHSKKYFWKNFFFEMKIFLEKNLEKKYDFFEEKKSSKILIKNFDQIQIFWKFWIFLENFWNFLSRKMFISKKYSFRKYFLLCRSKFFQRFQKSHLEKHPSTPAQLLTPLGAPKPKLSQIPKITCISKQEF